MRTHTLIFNRNCTNTTQSFHIYYILICYYSLSLSFSLSAFFFNRNGKKLPRKIQRPLYLKLIRWFWFVCAIHCLFLTYYSVCTLLKLWYLFLLFHTKSYAHKHKTRTENSLKLKIWWTTFQLSNGTFIQNHF